MPGRPTQPPTRVGKQHTRRPHHQERLGFLMTDTHPPTPDRNDRTARTVELHIALIAALVGPTRLARCPLDLRVMGVLHSLSEAERQVIGDFAAQCLAIRATYTLTAREVAERLKVSTRLVQRLAQAGALNGSRINGRWRFTEQQLERFTLACAYVNGGGIPPPQGPPPLGAGPARPGVLGPARLGGGGWGSRPPPPAPAAS